MGSSRSGENRNIRHDPFDRKRYGMFGTHGVQTRKKSRWIWVWVYWERVSLTLGVAQQPHLGQNDLLPLTFLIRH